MITLTWFLIIARLGSSDCVTAWVLDPENWSQVGTTAPTQPNFLSCGAYPGCSQYNTATTEFSVAPTCISAAADGTTTLTYTSDDIYKLKIQDFIATADFCGIPDPNGEIGTVEVKCKEQEKNGGTQFTTPFGYDPHVLDGSIPTSPQPIGCSAPTGYIYEIRITFNRSGVTLFDPKICTRDGDIYNQPIQLRNFQRDQEGSVGNPMPGPFVGWLQCFAQGSFRCSFSSTFPATFTRIPAMLRPETFFTLQMNETGTFMLRVGDSNIFVYKGTDCNDPSATQVMSIADFTQEDFKNRASLRFLDLSNGQIPPGFWYMVVEADKMGSLYSFIGCSLPNGTNSLPAACAMTGFAESRNQRFSELRDSLTLWQAIPVIANATNTGATVGIC